MAVGSYQLAVEDKKRRLFFALWPSAQVRDSVVETENPLLQGMNGHIIAPKNFHITLHFIGSVTDATKDCLHTSAQSIVFKPFDVCLDYFGFFSKAKIFWMAAQSMPPELAGLHSKLGEALSVCDFKPDPRPYSPHVSLLRKARKVEIKHPPFTIDWHVDGFVLVESVSTTGGVDYRVIEKYPLQH